jgi:hypothetical protein
MPEQAFTIGGFRPTGELRIRPTSFFGFCVVEELIEYSDGRKVWQKIRWEKPFAAAHRSAA